jgi:glucosamine 6-phosphate synthetase-like amidotransferase/phosphosugar isomerase protein
MCGIAAGSNLLKTFNLYSSNLYRGCYSTGILIVDFKNDKVWPLKYKGIVSILEIQNFIDKNNINVSYVLMHSRAPTNTSEHQFNEDDNHPFLYDELYAAHNGIITNFKILNKDSKLKVDSSIIPILVRNDGIAQAFEKMKGLLTCWLYDNNNKDIFFIKAGSTLFFDDEGYFSSSQFENSRPANDGNVFKLIEGKYHLIENFSYVNPYYV